mmetsp:Transcript_24613/g.30951  ORF Transcript_24613/g.30951 Transcript_24613/m.30951 type:complete len:154 (-) Transcript_24613:239-700(-)|eukprot:CAMPEP_0203636096 /NCGR_PEP_ID=MMETSP0088-20131115/2721_1 /ASSEMBLY_ACC=CAM_ASM_001087 /TAXON_ID=426623 /ORGANISM="Chaetoceros affinis, Strain CCMP159" /LENGTH=153 /DNA_ID=CAMNT_0050490147 /DNA_START=156 /DNA_END=617 /DNA_ORIENTATION=-
MPRSRRGGRSSGFSRPAPQRRQASTTTATPPAPRPAAAPPATQSSSGGMLSGIGSTIAQGMAFGTGSAIAHRAVGAAANAMTGGSSEGAPVEMQQQQQPEMMGQQQQLQGACAQDKQMFFECLKVNQGDQTSCSFLYDTLQSCQRNENQMSFQ